MKPTSESSTGSSAPDTQRLRSRYGVEMNTGTIQARIVYQPAPRRPSDNAPRLALGLLLGFVLACLIGTLGVGGGGVAVGLGLLALVALACNRGV